MCMAEVPGGSTAGKKVSGSEKGPETQAEVTRRAEEGRELAGDSDARRKIGLAAVLHARKVSGVKSASCICGWRKQDIKQVLMFCSEMEGRPEMLEAAGAKDFEKLLSTNTGLKASTKSS